MSTTPCRFLRRVTGNVRGASAGNVGALLRRSIARARGNELALLPVTEQPYSYQAMGTSAFEAAVRADIEAHPPVMDAAEREGIALAAIERANVADRFPHPDDLADGLALVVLRTSSPRSQQLAFDDGVISVQRRALWPTHEFLAVAHELAENLLIPYRHSHGDVWLLALALLMPRDVLHLLTYYVPWCPAWAIELREEMMQARAA